MIALSTLGLGLSSYLSWHYLKGGSPIGCGGGGPCDEVLNSRWSAIAGTLPVSGLAVGTYLALLVCGFSIGPATAAPVRRLAWAALLVLTGAAAGSAVWFTIVQKWFLGAFCPYCLATHLTSLLLAVLVMGRATRLIGDDPKLSGRYFVITRMACGLVAAALLAAAQVGLPSSANYRNGESPSQLAAVDTHTVPLVGSPDARYIVTLLFDYQCPHCQQLHLMLGEAIRRYNGQLAFALCPAPLSRRCNPYIPRDAEEFKDSCEVARIALTVWRADRAEFPVFESWMYSFDSGDHWRPRSPSAARAKAVELVGRTKFDAASNDPWIDLYLQTSVRIYGETMQNGTGAIPKLIFGLRWVTPQSSSTADLIFILQSSLGIPKP